MTRHLCEAQAGECGLCVGFQDPRVVDEEIGPERERVKGAPFGTGLETAYADGVQVATLPADERRGTADRDVGDGVVEFVDEACQAEAEGGQGIGAGGCQKWSGAGCRKPGFGCAGLA